MTTRMFRHLFPPTAPAIGPAYWLLFKRLKEDIVCLKDAGRVLMRFNELRETLQLRLLGEFERFSDDHSVR